MSDITIGTEIKAPPNVKVLLAKSDFTEIEKLLNSGWKMGSSFNHPEGVLLILVKA